MQPRGAISKVGLLVEAVHATVAGHHTRHVVERLLEGVDEGALDVFEVFRLDSPSNGRRAPDVGDVERVVLDVDELESI